MESGCGQKKQSHSGKFQHRELVKWIKKKMRSQEGATQKSSRARSLCHSSVLGTKTVLPGPNNWAQLGDAGTMEDLGDNSRSWAQPEPQRRHWYSWSGHPGTARSRNSLAFPSLPPSCHSLISPFGQTRWKPGLHRTWEAHLAGSAERIKNREENEQGKDQRQIAGQSSW